MRRTRSEEVVRLAALVVVAATMVRWLINHDHFEGTVVGLLAMIACLVATT